ncbi:MAG: hypothetical protein BRD51_00640 [Bacteroidetes bacterium SW_11_64_17]|nr:MAG: hypothetical protein BRD51_00640 [Bacteroidetes bacterium SW_11_64_17]
MLQRLSLAAFGLLLIVEIGAGPHSAVANPPGPTPADPAISSVLSERSDSTRLGVVWTPPAAPDSAVSELTRIAGLGATAVRGSRLPADTVAARADSLGLHLYVDLPVAYVSATQLQDTLAGAAPTLDRLRALARRHASITHVGLARGADTTVPAACAPLRRWADRVRKGEAALRTYYVTPFPPAADRCAEAVDQVLLALPGDPAPVERWRDWQSEHPSVGLGAVGTWVRPGAETGLRIPHSPEQQARYLEAAFSQLLDSTRTSPPIVFVARWRDRSGPRLTSRRYGLHDATGSPRLAARVVRGVYTGTQRTFAFPAGAEPPSGPYGLVLFGWGLVALLGGLYAQNVFVRQTVGRYFTAPGFYRDALRDGHDLHPDANGLLLILVAGALGAVGTCAARLAALQPGTEHMLAALPSDLQSVLATGIEHPRTAGLIVGGGGLALLLLWMGALVLVARRRTWFSVAQGLVLVVWPCWPALVGLPIALAAGPDSPLTPSLFLFLLLGGGGLMLVYVTGRVLYDYWAVTDLSRVTVFFLGLLSPLVLLGTALLILALRYDLSFAYFWRLATLT